MSCSEKLTTKELWSPTHRASWHSSWLCTCHERQASAAVTAAFPCTTPPQAHLQPTLATLSLPSFSFELLPPSLAQVGESLLHLSQRALNNNSQLQLTPTAQIPVPPASRPLSIASWPPLAPPSRTLPHPNATKASGSSVPSRAFSPAALRRVPNSPPTRRAPTPLRRGTRTGTFSCTRYGVRRAEPALGLLF